MYQRLHVRFRLPAMRRDELSAAITQLLSKCLWSGWKRQKGYEEIVSPFICCPVNREYSWEKSQIEKKLKQRKQIMFIKGVLNLSLRKSLLYRNQSTDLQNRSMDWFLCDSNLLHGSVNALLLACIHWDIFLDYDKTIDIYAFKHQRRMLLINPLSKN